MARPGEFTQRAFLNGRIDLSQAEAVEDMIEASSDPSARQAIFAVRGEIRTLLEPLIDDLLDLIANIEVNIDYPEYEDAVMLTADLLLPKSRDLIGRMKHILEVSRQGAALQEGVNTVIVGKPNVGKSSLLNALLHEDKAIVTDIPGTTRDLVEGRVQIGDFLLRLTDTAGIRKSEDKVETIGIEKSRKSMDQADLILLVLDGSRPLDEQDQELLKLTEGRKRIILVNKNDLPSAFTIDGAVSISAMQQDLKPLENALCDLFDRDVLIWKPRLSNERQMGLLETAIADMMRAQEAMEQQTETDLIEIDLQAAYSHLKEILGEVHRDDLLDTLFSNFCLGK